MMHYISVHDFAAKVHVSTQRVYRWLAQGRISGARRIAGHWCIPKKARRPKPKERT